MVDLYSFTIRMKSKLEFLLKRSTYSFFQLRFHLFKSSIEFVNLFCRTFSILVVFLHLELNIFYFLFCSALIFNSLVILPGFVIKRCFQIAALEIEAKQDSNQIYRPTTRIQFLQYLNICVSDRFLIQAWMKSL